MYCEYETSDEVYDLLASHRMWKSINRNMIAVLIGLCFGVILHCLAVRTFNVVFLVFEGTMFTFAISMWIVSFYLYRKRMIQAYKQAQFEKKQANLPYVIGSDPD